MSDPEMELNNSIDRMYRSGKTEEMQRAFDLMEHWLNTSNVNFHSFHRAQIA